MKYQPNQHFSQQSSTTQKKELNLDISQVWMMEGYKYFIKVKT